MISYADLIKPTTWQALVKSCLGVLKSFSLPTYAWQETSFPRGVVETEARHLADLSTTIANVAKGGNVIDAEKDWLTAHAWSQFHEERAPAVRSEREVILYNALGTMRTWGVGQLVVTSKTSRVVYRNVGAAVTLPAASGNTAGRVTVTVTADVAGSDNTTGASLVLGTPMPGVTLTVPEAFTVIGAPEESDYSLRSRCILKWSALSTTSPSESYEYWGRKSHPEINRIGVIEHLGAVAPDPDVTVIAASATGVPSSPALEAFFAAIELHRPCGVRVAATYASPYTIPLRGTVYITPGSGDTVKSDVDTLLRAFFEELPLGKDVLHVSIIRLVQAIPGVKKAALQDETGAPLTTEGQWDVPDNAVPTLARLFEFQEMA